MATVRVDVEVNEKGGEKITAIEGNLRNLGDSAKKAGLDLSNIGEGALQTITAFFAVQKAVELATAAITSLPAEVERVVSKASGLADLSAKLDMSTESAQRLAYMGSLVGVSVDSMAAAALKLQKNLAEHPALFDKWGLSAKQLRDMKPEEQLVAISNAIRAIGDREHQVAAITDLMGKGGAENLGLMRQDLANLSAEADDLGVAMGDKLVGKLDDVDDASTRLHATWEGLKDKLVGGVVAASGADEMLNHLAELIGAISVKAKDGETPLSIWVGLVERLAGITQLKEGLAMLALFNEGMPAVKGSKGISSTPASIDAEAARIMRDALRITEDQAKADDRAAEAAKRYAAALAKIAQEGKYTHAVQKAFDDLLDKIEIDIALAVMKAKILDRGDLGSMIPKAKIPTFFFDPNDPSLSESTKKRLAALDEEAKHYNDLAAAAEHLGRIVGGPLGTAFSGAAGVFDALTAHSKQAAENLKTNGTTAMTTGQKMLALAGTVLAVGAAFQKGVQSADKWGSAVSGAASGAAAGAAFGPWGALVGGVVGGVAGYLGGAKGALQQLQALRAAFLATMHQAELAGVALKYTFDPKTPEQYKEAIDEVKKALDIQAEGIQAVKDAMQKWGITIDQLGPKFRAQLLGEQLLDLYKDFKILEAAGASAADLFASKWGDSFKEAVQTAIRTGTEIPEALRPLVQWLVDHHELLDENGHAYETLESTGITFSQTMSQQFQTLLGHIQDLIDAINNWVLPDKNLDIYEHYHPDPSHNNNNSNAGGNTPSDPNAGWLGPGYNKPSAGGGIDHDGDPDTPMAMGYEGWILPRRGGVRLNVAEAGRPEYLRISPNGPGSDQGAKSGPEVLVFHNYLYPGADVLDTTIMRRVRGGYIKVA